MPTRLPPWFSGPRTGFSADIFRAGIEAMGGTLSWRITPTERRGALRRLSISAMSFA
jgi:hypothetical protein